MTAKETTASRQQGFTLIELSIVLVIIGLVIGGVMVGKSLIESGRVRAQISQFQEYETAVNGFKIKYNCLPGDCVEAANFALGSNGNGNGSIETITDFSNYTTPGGYYDGEFPQFFLHLKASGLIKQNLSGRFTSGGGLYPLLAINDNYGMIAGGKWHDGNTRTLPNQLATNWNFPAGMWLHATICGDDRSGPRYAHDGCGVMTPAQAYAIDIKFDDGKPLNGKIWGYGSGISPALDSPCLNISYTAYDLTNTLPYCQMSYKIQ